MTLHLTIAARPEALVDRLAERLALPSDDPFASDLVVVPNAGMREWVATCLMDRLGVLAGVEFLFPAELVRRSVGLPTPDDDPWRPERLAWHVLALLVEGAPLGRTPWEGLPSRPWTVARRIADLLERTASQRPDVALGWLDERATDPLDAAHQWQPAMWRALRQRVATPTSAEQLHAALVTDAAGPDLPARLHVFGLSSLPGPLAGVLVHRANTHDVHVLATTAAEGAVRAALRVHPATPDTGRDVGPTTLLVAPPRPPDVAPDTHPLLASWGRSTLEAATLVARLPVTPTVLDTVPLQPGRTQLARLQAEVCAAVPVGPRADDHERGGDGSIQVHACHGLTRQLEVLRDALLHAMASDPTLQPRDIAVLCTDLETVAPLAVPILSADVDGRHLPVLVTDRAASTTPPVHVALDAALALATSRLDRDTVLTFLALPVVTAALGLDADDLALLERLADDLDVRWGRDASHRQRWGYPAGMTVGTWRESLDRFLLGLLADADGGLFSGLEPASGLGLHDLARAGRLADALTAVATLADFDDPDTGRRPMADWALPLRWLVDTLLRPRRSVDAASHAYASQAAHVRELVDGLIADAEAAEVTHPIDVREVRAALDDRLRGGGSSARLRTGQVSVASLAPLRGVPFRVVAIVGVADTSLTGPSPDDDDVLAHTPRLGEREASGERRAAVLDAVLAARDLLIVTCDGQDVRSGARLDLPTVVEELLDALPPVEERPTVDGGSRPEGTPVVVRHPRHLADRRNLTTGPHATPRVHTDRPWTFAPSALRALAAMERADGPRVRPGAGAGVLTASTGASRWHTVPLPDHPWEPPTSAPLDTTLFELDDLVDALARPADVLLRHRLGIRLPRARTSNPRSVELWVEDPLARWALGQELLDHLVAGGSVDGWVATRPARGGVPPGRLGQALLATVAEEVVALHDAAQRPVTTPRAASPHVERPGTLVTSHPISVDLTLPPAPHRVRHVRLVGGVTHADGNVVDVRFSRDHRRHLVSAAVGLLAATAAQQPDEPATVTAARIVRRAASGARDQTPLRHQLTLADDDARARIATARAALTALADLALRVRSGPSVLLPRAAWSIDTATDLTVAPSGTFARDLDKDLATAAFGVIVGARTLGELALQEHGPLEDGLPDAPTPVQRWSLALRGPLEEPFALATAAPGATGGDR